MEVSESLVLIDHTCSVGRCTHHRPTLSSIQSLFSSKYNSEPRYCCMRPVSAVVWGFPETVKKYDRSCGKSIPPCSFSKARVWRLQHLLGTTLKHELQMIHQIAKPVHPPGSWYGCFPLRGAAAAHQLPTNYTWETSYPKLRFEYMLKTRHTVPIVAYIISF